MIVSIIIILASFYWLLRETDYLRVKLLAGLEATPKYARYKAYNILKSRKPNWRDTAIHEGDNYPAGYSPNGEPEYNIVLTPGINNILCGWDWLNKHVADMVDYQPKVEMTTGGVKYNMTIKQPAIIKDIMKANHLTKKQKLAYA